MNAARDDVAFLARSKNRVTVLTVIGTDPVSRAELQKQTHVERVTLGRILTDFTDRGWVKKTGRRYALTPTGEMVAGDFEKLLETVATASKLESVIQWLPTEKMPFDLRHLGSADITLPTSTDPAAPTRRAGQRLRTTKTARILMRAIISEVVDACWAATIEDDQQFEAVFSADVLDTIAADHTMSTKIHEMLTLDNVAIYRFEEDFPFAMGVIDDLAGFGVTNDESLPQAYLEIENKVVRDWVKKTYDRHKQDATRLGPDDITI